jgi:putative aldouronate transport system permease protein
VRVKSAAKVGVVNEGNLFNSSRTRKLVGLRIWRSRYIYLMVLPVVLYFVLFKYLPMWFLRSAFYDYKLLKGFEGSNFVGLKYFFRLFTNPNLITYISNTLILNFSALIFLFPAPLIFAILLNELRNARFMKIVQTISYLPHFVSTVVLVSMISTIISPSYGSLAALAKLFGNTPVNYLSIPQYFVTINVISGFWQSVGWEAVIYVATLAGIDRGLYEAARIDGANRWQQILHVTLPGLSSTFVILLIMQIGQLLNVNFEKVYLLQNTLNLSASEMLPTFVYKTGMESHNYGYATAAGLFNSVCSVILVVAANTIARKVSDTSLF